MNEKSSLIKNFQWKDSGSKFKKLPNNYEGEIQALLFTIPDNHYKKVATVIVSLLKVFKTSHDEIIEAYIFVSELSNGKFEVDPAWGFFKNTNVVIKKNVVENINSKWIQDDFVLLLGRTWLGKKYPVFNIPSTGSSNPIKQISDKLKIPTKPMPHSLVGGNLLRLGDYLLVGMDSIEPRNGKVDFSKIKLFIKKFGFNLTNLIFIGSCDAPLVGCQSAKFFHIDLGILIINSKNVIVAIPEENVKDITYVIDVLVSDLEERYINVEMFNIPLLGNGLNKYYPYYTNALVETRGGEIHLYIPDFGLEKCKKDLSDIFETLKCKELIIKPHWIQGDFHSLTAREGGSLHCMTKVIKRKI